LGIQIEY